MSEKAKLDSELILKTLHSRISKDIADASKYLTPIEISGLLWHILHDVTVASKE